MLSVKHCLYALTTFSLLIGQAQGILGQEKTIVTKSGIIATRELMAVTYPEGATISVKFKGTHRLPKANGEAKVERKKGMTEIEIELDEMKPATGFGGDYNTYVLWAASPEGQVNNIGEFILQGNRSKLNVSTPMNTFGIFVTAEPHFLVPNPSRFVVVENSRLAGNVSGSMAKPSQIKYKGFEGTYEFQQETLVNIPEGKGEMRTGPRQARTAVKLAERAGADRFAAAELSLARASLQKVESAERGGVKARELTNLSHDAIRQALAAQNLAGERSAQAALSAERRAQAQETARLEKTTEKAKLEADKAKLEADKAKSEAELAKLKAERGAQQAAEEERSRREAEVRARQAEQEARQLAAAKSEAESAAERARRERADARGQLLQALGRIAETRETVRGLIVNLPDILFETGKATLNPQAREVLSKISGILLVAGGYKLHIEGHTDSVGRDDYNQKLSEMRAVSVRDYLLRSGVASNLMSTQGWGKAQPIASNDQAAGRQKNRRVEIVIEELGDFKYRP